MISLLTAALYTVGRLSFGGAVVEIDGDRLYASSGSAVEIYDVSTPSSPVLLSRVPYTGNGRILTMDLSGDTLFVGTAGGDVVALDVSDYSHPRVIGTASFSDAVVSLRVKDSTLLIANGYFGLRVLRRSDLSELSSLSVSSYSVGIDYRGDTVLLTSTGVPISVIDVSDPTSPSLIVSHTTLPGCDGGLYVRVLSGGYTALRCGDTVKVYDLSDVSSPSYIATVGDANVLPYLKDTLLTLAYDNHVYVFSVSDPTSPNLLGDTSVGFVSHAAASGEELYVFTKWPFKTFLVISYPTSTVLYEARLPGVSSSVEKSGGYLYIYNQGLSVVDITSPSNPQLLSFIPVSFGLWSSSAASMDLMGTSLFVAGITGNEIKVYDVSDPSSPTLDTSYSISTAIYSCLKAVDSLSVVVCGNSSLDLIDLSSMSVTSLPPARGVDLTPDGSYAVAVGGGEVRVIDMATFSVVGTASLPSGANALQVTVDGSNAYVMYLTGTDSVNVAVVDISSPTSPTLLGSTFVSRIRYSDFTLYLPGKLQKVGNYLFGSVASLAPFVIDVSDPTSPDVVEVLRTPGYGTDMVVSDGNVYQLDYFTGLTVFRAPLPTSVSEREPSPVPVPFILKGRELRSDYEVKVYTASGRLLHTGKGYRFDRSGVFFVVVEGKGYRVVVR